MNYNERKGKIKNNFNDLGIINEENTTLTIEIKGSSIVIFFNFLKFILLLFCPNKGLN